MHHRICIFGMIAAFLFGVTGLSWADWNTDLRNAQGMAGISFKNRTTGALANAIRKNDSPFSIKICTLPIQESYSSTHWKKARQISQLVTTFREKEEDALKAASDVTAVAKSADREEAPRLLQIMEAPYRNTLTKCDRSIIQLESELRHTGREIEKRIEELKRQIPDPATKNEEGAKQKEELTENQRALEMVKATISYVPSDAFLKTFDDYNDGFYYKFNLGYEYATVKSVFQKGFPRIGFLIYHQYTPEGTKMRDRKPGWKLGEVHTSLAARLTSSAEEATKENPDTTADPTINAGDKPALEYDIQMFLPVAKTTNAGNLWSVIGPIGVYGGSKTDDVKRIHQRYYGGIRLAMSPELYTDVLYGKTEGTHSRRLEIRGQMPIYRPTGGSPIVIGAIANIGIQNVEWTVDSQNAPTPREADSVRIYVSWDIDMKDIFKIFNPSSK